MSEENNTVKKQFVIDQVSWHISTPGNVESRNHIEWRFRILAAFLEDNGLAKRVLLSSKDVITDAFCISTSDLTDEGFELMRRGYDKWLRALDKGKDPGYTRILQRILEGIRK